MPEAIQGLKALERKLQHLATHGSSRISRAAVTGAAQPLRKAIRRQVNASSASPAMKRAARRTIGSSVKKRGGDYVLKVGLGVGRQSKAKKIAASERADQGGGVGISATNIHWPVLGTKNRRRKSPPGKSTGSTPAVFQGVVEIAVVGAIPAAMRKAGEKARIALIKEAQKRR